MKSIKPSLLALAIATHFSAFADDAKPKQDMERLVITATGFEQKSALSGGVDGWHDCANCRGKV